MNTNASRITFEYENCDNLSIHKIEINGKVRAIPTLSLAKESRQNFKDMKLAIINILAAYGNVEIEDLSNKITFSMADITSQTDAKLESQVALEVQRYTIDDSNALKSFDEYFDLIIDVRTPKEFREDHIPNAVNMAVLNNEERCTVGTMYSEGKKEEGDTKSARGIGAAIICRSIANTIEEHFLNLSKESKILVYCWRGGLRSKSLAVILKQIGFDGTKLLTGGYKSFRQHIQNSLPKLVPSHQYLVLAGNTGTGKSLILECMQEKGEQVLHLEELAKHKGSVLGPYFACEQPSQKQFETELWNFLRKADCRKKIWLEHEGIQIGKLYLPKDLYQMINDSPKIFIKVDLKSRVDHLLRDYCYYIENPETLIPLLNKLVKFAGKKQVMEWREMLSKRNFFGLVSSLITEHYDKAYEMKRRREVTEMGTNSSDAVFEWPNNLELKRHTILSCNVIDDIKVLIQRAPESS